MHFVFLTLIFSLMAFAHQASLDLAGNELYWANKNIPLVIRTNTSDLTSAQISTTILSSINQWNSVTSAKLNSVGDATNEIKFLTNFPYGSGVLGLTELTFNSSGAIQGASVLLNDDYLFKSAPGLYPSGQVYLGDVVTHELGHFLGLSHSEVLNSSMFYSSFSGQASISLDDKTGIRQKYDLGYGVISGYVKGGKSIGVLGAHVQAISRKTGDVSAAITDEKGYFRLGGLDLEDTYYLYTAPLKNVSSLPGYFANAQDEFCPSAYVGSFYSQCGRENDGIPQGINLTSNDSEIDVGTISISCNLKTSSDYDYEKIQTTFTPITIYDYGVDLKSEKAFVGWSRKTTSTGWSAPDLLNVDLSAFTDLASTKYLKISLLSYPFGSQVEYEMIVKKNGATVVTKTMALSPTTQTYNPDFEVYLALGTNPADNIFEISIKSRKLSASTSAQTFPSFDQFSSNSYLPYLVINSLFEMTPQGLAPILDSGVNLSDNASCLDGPYTYAVSKAIGTDKQNTSASNSQGPVAAGCGTIEPPSSGDGPGSSMPIFMMGFLITLIASNIVKSRKKFLS